MRRISALVVLLLTIAALPWTTMAVPMMTETIVEDFHFTWDDHTYMYASIVDFYETTPDVWNGGVWFGTGDGLDPSLNWSHTLPPGLQVPPDEVMRAKLKIDGEYIDSQGNLIEINGTWDWDPLDHMWFDNTVYSLTDVNEPGFWNGGMLDLSILAGEYDLRIDEAVLMMDYAYAVPEPASLLLIGLGLMGVAGYRKIRK